MGAFSTLWIALNDQLSKLDQLSKYVCSVWSVVCGIGMNLFITRIRVKTEKRYILRNRFFKILWCFLFYHKMCISFKTVILCLFLKNVSPFKRMVCFILNNLNFPVVVGIAFYILYKSRVLMISSKAMMTFVYL